MVGGRPWGIDRSEASGEFGDIGVAQAGFGADENVALNGMTFDLILVDFFIYSIWALTGSSFVFLGVWRKVCISGLRQDDDVGCAPIQVIWMTVEFDVRIDGATRRSTKNTELGRAGHPHSETGFGMDCARRSF